jgi:hypothetical protein
LLSSLAGFHAPASAQDRGFALDRFAPSPTAEDGLALVLPRTLPHLAPSAQLVLDYAHRPLVLGLGGTERAIVGHRFLAHALLGLGLGTRGEVFVHVPVALVQTGDSPSLGDVQLRDPGGASLAALRMGGAVRVHGEDKGPVQLGIFGALHIPSGGSGKLSADTGLGLEVRGTAAYHQGPLTLGANLGLRYRPRVRYGTTRIGTELPITLGGSYRVTRDLSALAELNTALTLRKGQAFRSAGTPMEALLGARLATPLLPVSLTAALGVGLTQASGTPDVRVLVSGGYPAFRGRGATADADRDGLPDDVDHCPSAPEDTDGFNDLDGCPDTDNDQDGLPDIHDACTSEAEDVDGFEDDDGCPDADNDNDGIPDATDQCPVAAEDTDGFGDQDGCPDVDNDLDGIPDPNDACVDEAEDMDGFADDDGCPESDNDQDGIADVDDRCPTVAGTLQGQGCPLSTGGGRQPSLPPGGRGGAAGPVGLTVPGGVP